MHDLTINSRDREAFLHFMKESPVRFQTVEIQRESRSEDGIELALSLEVTDPPSVLAAAVLKMRRFSEEMDPEKVSLVTPAFLGIETFMRIQQTWHVVKKETKCMIDLGTRRVDIPSGSPQVPPESRTDRSSNIMNYVLDSAGGIWSSGDESTRDIARKGGKQALALVLQMEIPSLLTSLHMDLGLPADENSVREQTKKWLNESQPKVVQGRDKMARLQSLVTKPVNVKD